MKRTLPKNQTIRIYTPWGGKRQEDLDINLVQAFARGADQNEMARLRLFVKGETARVKTVNAHQKTLLEQFRNAGIPLIPARPLETEIERDNPHNRDTKLYWLRADMTRLLARENDGGVSLYIDGLETNNHSGALVRKGFLPCNENFEPLTPRELYDQVRADRFENVATIPLYDKPLIDAAPAPAEFSHADIN